MEDRTKNTYSSIIMNDDFSGAELHNVVENLCEPGSYRTVYHRANHLIPMPSIEILGDIVDLLKSIIFPGYFINSEVRPETMKYYIGSKIDRIFILLAEQVKRGFCFLCDGTRDSCEDCELRAKNISRELLIKLPLIRHMLSTDALAAYEGDPAAKDIGETIFCYPSMSALSNYRIAHELYLKDVPLIPRIITEMAHSTTGIDIHPGAQIGEYFFVDHGTGTVIGETCIIGKRVRIYQGVTLGAKSFPLDKSGNPIKGIPRHPVVEDNVTVYSGATILGRVTIGEGAEIGGNVWLTRSVPGGARVIQHSADECKFENGAGI